MYCHIFKKLGLVVFIILLSFFFIDSEKSYAENSGSINEFDNMHPSDIVKYLDDLPWIAHGNLESSKIVYRLGGTWCPATHKDYHYTIEHNEDEIQFRYIFASPRDRNSLFKGQLLAGTRDPEVLKRICSQQTVKVNASIENEVSYDGTFITVQMLKKYLKT